MIHTALPPDTDSLRARPPRGGASAAAIGLCPAIREEVRVDEMIDHRLGGGFDLVELHPHADAAVAPDDSAFGVEIPLRPRHPEPHLDRRARLERTRRPDRDATVAQIERQ